MGKQSILALLACTACLGCAGMVAAEDAWWTVYSPMGAEAEQPDQIVTIRPGAAPGSEDGVVLIAAPPPGYCPLPAEPSAKQGLWAEYGLAASPGELPLGLAVDCDSRAGSDGASEAQRRAAYLSFHPLVSTAGPVWLGVSRPDFLSMFRDAADSVPRFEIPGGGEEEAIPAIGRWLSEGPGRPDEPGGAFLAMPLGRDESAATRPFCGRRSPADAARSAPSSMAIRSSTACLQSSARSPRSRRPRTFDRCTGPPGSTRGISLL